MNNIALDLIKSEMVEKVINELSNIQYMTEADKTIYRNELISKANERTLVTTPRYQSELTDAYAYNKTAYEIYLDILTTFSFVDEVYNIINQHQELNKAILGTLKSTIAMLNDKLDEYEAIIGIEGSPSCYIEGFRTLNNMETDKQYYTERYGEPMPKTTYVKFNPEQENITLNYTRQQNVMVYRSGVQLGKIDISKQYGNGFIKVRNSESKLENAIDTSPNSYWSETILCDAELKIKGMGFDDGNGVHNRSFYDLPRGAMCELCLTFESIAKVNEIVLNPFGDYPIDIIAIRYSLSDDEDDECYDILCPDNQKYDWLKDTTIRKETAFHFPEVKCKRLYILFNQLHCVKNSYMISCNQMLKNELWFNATNKSSDIVSTDNTTVFKPIYFDKGMDDAVWKYINNKMNTNKNIDVNSLLVTNNQKQLPTTKYEYTYGFYNIAPNFVEFQKTGIYVSKEIDVGNAIHTIKLYSDENHFLSTEGEYVTDVEYYITSKKNPSYKDWHPICPYNKDYIYNERLQLDYAYCYLRHKAVCGNIETTDKNGNAISNMIRPVVKMNDIVMTEDADYILRYDKDMNVEAIEISNIDHFALYTVSYQPIDTSKELNLINEDNPIQNNSYEEIMGDGSACYELSNVPYFNKINPMSSNSYVKLININTGVTYSQTDFPDSPVQCVTDKENPSNSFKRLKQTTNRFLYYTNGNCLYFNQPIPKNMKIEINYPSFDSKVRVKIILRRNTKRNSWITPILNNFRLEFTTL